MDSQDILQEFLLVINFDHTINFELFRSCSGTIPSDASVDLYNALSAQRSQLLSQALDKPPFEKLKGGQLITNTYTKLLANPEALLDENIIILLSQVLMHENLFLDRIQQEVSDTLHHIEAYTG